MKRIYQWIFLLFVCGNVLAQNNIVQYEYWFNNNYTSKVQTNITPAQTFNLQTTIPCSNLDVGMHVFNIRFKDSEGQWSSTESRYCYKVGNQDSNVIVAYEYWIDNAPAIAQNITPAAQYSLSQNIALDTLQAGIHCINFRFKDAHGQWSSTVSRYFQKLQDMSANKLVAYEYWLNDMYDQKQTGSINNLQSFVIFDSLDISKATKATNYIHFRFKDTMGNWSSVLSQDFYRPVEPNFTAIVGLSDVAFTNTTKYADTYKWNFGDGTAINTQVNPEHTYAEPGAYEVTLIAKNKMFTDSVKKYVEVEGIKMISNHKGGNEGYASFDIYGGGLDTTTVVKLVSGGTTISTYRVYKKEPGIICATFNLTGKTTGLYDIVITINGTNYTITDGFEIEEANYSAVWTELKGNTVFIPGRWQTYTVNYGNAGNTDIYGVPVNLILSDNVECEFAFDLIDSIGGNSLDINNPDSYVTLTSLTSELFNGQSILDVYNFINTPSDIVALSTVAFNGKMYSIFIPHIPANTSGSFSVRLKVNTSQATKVYVNTGEALNDIYFNTQEENIISSSIFGYRLTGIYNIFQETLSTIIRKEIDKSFTNQQTTFQKQYVNFINLLNTSGCFSNTNNFLSALNIVGRNNGVVDGGEWACDYHLNEYTRLIDKLPNLVPDGCGSGWNEPLVPDWIFLNACTMHDNGYSICHNEDEITKRDIDNQFLVNMCHSCRANYPYSPMLGPCLQAAGLYYAAVSIFGNSAYNDAQEISCGINFHKRELERISCPVPTPITPQRSSDPNEIIGTAGYGEFNYIGKTQNLLNYTLYFENDVEQATAPAQEIFLTDTLDLTKFNPDVFSFGTFTFRDITIEAIPGVTEFSKDVDLRPKGENIIVRISAVFDKTTGIITWHLIALDPETMDLTESPYLGILYPNTAPPIGEGNVTYSIGLRSNVGDGAVINNQGHITFDLNEPIATNVYSNTIDMSLPVSSMNSAYQIENDTVINLSWSGSDTGSGVRFYTVYVSENDSVYYVWQWQTAETSGKFAGKQGNTYKFYVIATDNVGNVESKNETSELTVDVQSSAIGTIYGTNVLKIKPNPVKDELKIDGNLSDNLPFTILDLTGKQIVNGQWQNGKSINVSSLASGVYFIKIGEYRGKFVKE